MTTALPPLTIRNLTPNSLRLQRVERYYAPRRLAPQRSQSFFKNLTATLTNSSSNVGQIDSGGTVPSAPEVAAGAQSWKKLDVDISISPFAVQTTEFTREQDEELRLTFECKEQRYRIDVPTDKAESQVLVPLDTEPKVQLTGVFIGRNAFLAVYSSADLDCWMGHLKDETPLSALSMPGTHNSPTHHRALPSVRCQAVSCHTQLLNGVRFFDVRVQPDSTSSPTLHLVHGAFPVALSGPKTFHHDLLRHIYAFLTDHPSETLVLSLKREGTGSCTDHDLHRILLEYYTGPSCPDASKWYTSPSIPTLGESRGKIVLMRRFALDPSLEASYAIDAECWADNTAHDLHGNVCVQDFYDLTDPTAIAQKTSYAEAQCERAATCVCHLPGITTDAAHPAPPQPFYLNFLSASNFWKKACWPERIAEALNPRMVEWLCEKHAITLGDVSELGGDGGTGIVVCDWVGKDGDWDLVRCIVGMNARLMVREMTL